MRKKIVYLFVTWTALIASVGLLVILSPILYSPEFIMADDFGHFWASGKLFITRENPYDLTSIAETQLKAGAYQSDNSGIGSLTMNPPWSLLIFAPFSLLNYSVARVAWLLVNVMAIVMAVKQLWQISNGLTNKLWLAFLISLCFSPTYSVLSKGQVTYLVLLGIVALLLYFEDKLNDWWAAACLLLVSIKPQLFYLFWPALLFWVIKHRRWKLLFSCAVIGLLTISVLLIVNPHIFKQYFSALQEYPFDQWATPTIGSYLRLFLLGVDKFWVQYLPALIGFIWFIFHYHHHPNWSWPKQLPILSLVSLLTAPYAWTYDSIIILPAIITATHWLSESSTSPGSVFWISYIIINSLNLLLHTQLNDFWFLWLAPAYALWYLAAKYWHQRNMVK